MDTAPAVDTALDTDPPARFALASLCAAASAAPVAWALGMLQAPGWLQGGAAALAGVAAGAAAWWRWRQARAQLRWDGNGWTLLDAGQSAPQPGTVTVAVDLDAWLLLRFDAADGARRWWALSRRRHRAVWHALRCALFAGHAEPSAAAGARL